MGKGLKSESGSLAAPRLATLIGAAVASWRRRGRRAPQERCDQVWCSS